MSKDKRKANTRRQALLDWVRQHGHILVNDYGGIGECADLKALAKAGKLRRVRIRVHSSFGNHIRRTHYVSKV
ncbi:MAG: hypothetical protein C0423_11465 [Methylibium sp.]|nr:hypothetical protein [Methylibium sp.]